MTALPAPPATVKWHEHPEHHWKWTKMELDWIAARDAQWQAVADAAVAQEREACEKAVESIGAGMFNCDANGSPSDEYIAKWRALDAVRARTKEKT